jgi:hypothetical protein
VAGHRDLGAEGMECPSMSPRCGFLSGACMRPPSSLSFLSVLLTVSVVPAILIGGILLFCLLASIISMKIEMIEQSVEPPKLVTLPIFCYF